MNRKLEAPFSISFHTFTHQENVLVGLQHNGVVGFGESAPFKPITLDSQEDVIRDLKILQSIELDPLHTSWEDFHAHLDNKVTGHTARAALDFAFHDLVGKLKNKPVWQLYAQKKNIRFNTVTIGIDTAEMMQKEAEHILESYPYIKAMKIKLAGENEDIDRCKAIARATAEKSLRFIVDANQGFKNPQKAVSTLTAIAEILGDVVLVEEPVTRGALDELKYVKEHMKGMLVFADESAVDLNDLRAVIKHEAAHGINIKLQKAGGIWQGKLMAKLAEEAGLQVMVGCMLEGPIAIAAGIHFAVSTPNVIITDLDADLSMPDHTKQMSPFVEGSRLPGEGCGLGVELDKEKIDILEKAGEFTLEQIF